MQQELITGNFKKAFQCKKCPQSNSENGCPMWWETIHANIQTGEEKILKGCGYQQLPTYLIEVVKASNRPAEEMSRIREQAVERIAAVTKQHLPQLEQA